MSICKKTIVINDKTNEQSFCHLIVCPDGYIPTLLEIKTFYGRGDKSSSNFEVFYVPEYYNRFDAIGLFYQWYDDKYPLSDFNTKSEKSSRGNTRSNLTQWHWCSKEDEEKCNQLEYRRYMTTENEKLCKEYREKRNNEWNTPLNENLHFLTYEECRVKFLDNGGSFEREKVKESA